MNYNNQNMDGSKLFKAIINNPKLLASLPVKYKYDKDFLELYYIILGNQIAPYIPTEIFKVLQNNEKNTKQLINKPNITLEDEYTILHMLLTNPKTLETIPTDEKYNNDFLELLYIIWGDKIEPYIPSEMFETLKNEALMHEYHQKHKQKQKQWVKEVQEKILSKNKNC